MKKTVKDWIKLSEESLQEVKHDLSYFQKQVESERPIDTGDIMNPRFSMVEYHRKVNQEAWNRFRKQ